MKKLVALLLTFLLVLAGCKSVEITRVDDDNNTDSIRFSKEYEMNNTNNLYKYSSYDNIIDTLNDKTGVIYLGFSSCDLCKKIVPVLNDAAKENKIKEILYYDFKDIRENNTKEYQELYNILRDYISTNDEELDKIKAPTVIFVNNGNITGIYIGTIDSDNEEIMNEEDKKKLKNNFIGLFKKMKQEKTSSESKEF